MQSILLATPTKSAATEINSDIKNTEATESVEGKGGEEKAPLRFSDVLGEVLKGDESNSDSETEQLSEALIATVSEEDQTTDLDPDSALTNEEVPDGLSLEEADTETDSDITKDTNVDTDKVLLEQGGAIESDPQEDDFPKSINGDNAISKERLSESNEQTLEDEPVADDLLVNSTEASSKAVNSESNDLEQNEKSPTLNASDAVKSASSAESPEELQQQEKSISPIIAQIEAAQKTDTKVTDTSSPEIKHKMTAEEVELALKDSKKSAKDTLQKTDKLTFENVLAEDSESSEPIAKELLAKDNLRHNDKLDNIISSLKIEADKPVFNQTQETFGLRSIGVANALPERALGQTTANSNTPLMQSAALQQPLELQAKHASKMVGERILMMLNQGKQEVTIRLDPAELGSMHIKLHVQQDQLSLAIQTQVGQSRDIIEQNLPRLREQLAQQGINLGDASVEQQSSREQSNSQKSQSSEQNSQLANKEDDALTEEQSQWLNAKIPLPAQGIDYYA